MKIAKSGVQPSSKRINHPDSPGIELSITTPIDKQIKWLRRIQPQILTTYPSNLREIGRLAAGGGPLHFHTLVTMGEMLSADIRATVRADFGLVPIDQYGSSEVGHVGGTCLHSGLHHVASELVRIEIVDEKGHPLAPGQEGRIIATPFYNLAMPLIRYDMGDYGMLSPSPCGCGRTLPVLQRIFGRTRNVFRFIDGSRKWPLLMSDVIQTLVPNRQWQIIQTALDRIELRYVPKSPDQVNDLAALSAYARQQLHPSVQVQTVVVERIDRSASGKVEDYISLIG